MKIIIQNIRDFLLRKKRKGKKLLFFEKIGDKNSSRDEIHENLMKVGTRKPTCEKETKENIFLLRFNQFWSPDGTQEGSKRGKTLPEKSTKISYQKKLWPGPPAD